MNNRYITFAGFAYYAAPGWQGFFGAHETKEEAEKAILETVKDNGFDWWQVVDLNVHEVCAGEGFSHTGLFGKFPANPASNVVTL